MIVGVISNYSVSSTVSLHPKIFLSLRFFLPLIPFILVFLFYFFVLSSLHFEGNSISFFSVCVLFACACSFIVESIIVAVTVCCFSVDGVMGSASSENDFALGFILDFKLYERLLGVVSLVFLVTFALAHTFFILES